VSAVHFTIPYAVNESEAGPAFVKDLASLHGLALPPPRRCCQTSGKSTRSAPSRRPAARYEFFWSLIGERPPRQNRYPHTLTTG